jgi:hypothetical protein
MSSVAFRACAAVFSLVAFRCSLLPLKCLCAAKGDRPDVAHPRQFNPTQGASAVRRGCHSLAQEATQDPMTQLASMSPIRPPQHDKEASIRSRAV